MAMKCPKCGAENPDYAMYCGKCAGSMKESEQSTVKEKYESPTQMVPLIQSRYLRIATMLLGIFLAIFGAIVVFVTAYAIAGGAGVTFTINDRMVSVEEGGPIFLVIGLVLLFVGFALRHAYHKTKPERAD